MGLPLYNAPVESDIPSRAAPKSPIHSRSAIRRVRRHDHTEWAETRHRLLAQELGRLSRENPAAADEPPTTNYWTGAAATSYTSPDGPWTRYRVSGDSQQRASAQDPVARRTVGLDERALTVMGERWANLYTRASPDSSILDREDLPPMRRSRPDRQPERQPAAARTVHRAVPFSSLSPSRRARLMAGIGRPARVSRGGYSPPSTSSRSPPPPPPPPPEPGSLYRPTPGRTSRERTRASPTPPLYVPSATTAAGAAQTARLDGLGDRNRSLSPEDGVWDTLLTTLTPDPQPPSVGSSFASTSASVSAATSQSAASGSSANTSLTGRDGAVDGPLSDPNCESACENSETEGDEDDDVDIDVDAVGNALHRFPRNSRSSGHRSYAEVAGRTGSNSSGGEDPLEFLGDMQRIVRHFARREDIPDEWWAEVGLSRTLSRASH